MTTFKPALAALCLGLAAAGAHAAGKLTVALAQDPGSLDPVDTFLTNWSPLGTNIFDGLVWRDPQLNIAPGLATSWEELDDGLRLRSATRELVNELRHARARAIASGQVQRVEVNPAERTWAAGDGRRGQWPDALAVRFTGAREVQPHAGAGAIVFFADGASSGGRIELSRGDAVMQIDVAWLTGQVRAGRGSAQ